MSQETPLDPTQLLEYTVGIRKKILDKLIKEDGSVTGDKEDKQLVGKLLADIDRVALSDKKNKSDKEISDKGDSILLQLAEVLKNDRPDKTPPPITERAPLIDLDNDIEMVPGETDIGTNVVEYNDESDK